MTHKSSTWLDARLITRACATGAYSTHLGCSLTHTRARAPAHPPPHARILSHGNARPRCCHPDRCECCRQKKYGGSWSLLGRPREAFLRMECTRCRSNSCSGLIRERRLGKAGRQDKWEWHGRSTQGTSGTRGRQLEKLPVTATA